MTSLTAARARLRERGAVPFTRDDLRATLARWGVHLPEPMTAEQAADALTRLSLEGAIVGQHDGRAITGERAYELVYGERLKL